MLLGNDVALLRFELTMQLAAPRSFLEGPVRPRRFLDRRDVRPVLVVAGPVPMMQGVEDLNVGVARRPQDLTHVLDAAVGFGNSFQAVPYLAALGDEVVVRIDHDQAGPACAVFHLVNSAPTRRRAPQFLTRFTYEAGYVTLRSMVVKPRVGVIGAGPGGIAMGIQ